MSWGSQDSAAARGGEFRNATRTNQNAAASVWPGGSYPYIDLLDDYDGSTPSNDEKNQMSVYVTAVGSPTPTLTPTTTATPAPTKTPSECVSDVNGNGVGDVEDVMATVVTPGCSMYLPLVVARWNQVW